MGEVLTSMTRIFAFIYFIFYLNTVSADNALIYSDLVSLKKFNIEKNEITEIFTQGDNFVNANISRVLRFNDKSIIVEGLSKNGKLYLFNLDSKTFKEITSGHSPNIKDAGNKQIFYWVGNELLFGTVLLDKIVNSISVLKESGYLIGELMEIKPDYFIYYKKNKILGYIENGVFVKKEIELDCKPELFISKNSQIICSSSDKRRISLNTIDANTFKFVNSIYLGERISHPVLYMKSENKVLFVQESPYSSSSLNYRLITFDLDKESFEVISDDVVFSKNNGILIEQLEKGNYP